MDTLTELLDDPWFNDIWWADDPWGSIIPVRSVKPTLYSIGNVTPMPMQRIQSRLFNLKTDDTQ